MKDKVSIIIPLHNTEAYIQATLDSCIKQSYQNLEIIVVENGSTDKSYEKAIAVKDPRISVYAIGKASAAKARNYGLQKATGAYIQFLDADDLLSPNKIAAQLTALRQKTGNWVASCAWAKFENDIAEAQVKEQQVWREENPIDWCIKSWQGGGMMIPGCWLIPRSLIEIAGEWNEDLTLHDDGEFMCRVLVNATGQVFVNDALVYYRQSANSLSKQNKDYKAAQSALSVYQSYERTIFTKKDNQLIRFSLAHNYSNFIYEFYPNHKDLIQRAKEQLDGLGLKKLPLVGGENFKRLATIVGFKNALKCKALLCSWASILNN